VRIAVVTQTPHRVGGAETYLDSVLGPLRTLGHELALCTQTGRLDDSPTLAHGVSDDEFAIRGDLEGFLDRLRRWRPDVLFLHGLDDVAAELGCRQLAPTVFFAHTYHGTCISGSKCFRLPAPMPCSRTFGPGCLVYYFPRRCGGLNPVTMVRLYGVQSRRLGVLRAYDAIVTLSEHMRAECVRHSVDPSRVTVLPQWAPKDAPSPGGRQKPPGPPWRLLLLGRLERVKGGGLLVAAMPEIARRLGAAVTLTVAGDGPDRQRLEGRARRAERANPLVEIVFAGRVGLEGRTSLLESSHLLVVPSLWPEPFGLVGLEAARAGVPAVGFAVGGIPEWLVDGVTGLLAGARPDRTALVGAVTRALSSPTGYARLCDGATARAASLEQATHLAALDAVFTSIARRPS
jgi:glycosyltransferase involved in cell wall biosynthesis